MNAIRLVAIDRVEGWAYVQTGEETFFVQPPYLITNLVRTDASTVSDAVDACDYEPVDRKPFDSWDELFQWLNARFVEERTKLQLPMPSQRDTQQYIRESSDGDVREFLHIVRTELLPNGRYETARRLIDDLREATVVKNSTSLQAQVVKLKNLTESRLQYGDKPCVPLGGSTRHAEDDIVGTMEMPSGRLISGAREGVRPLCYG